MTVEEYLHSLPSDQKEPYQKLRQTILEKLPEGLEERIQYGMIGYVVPHSLYPAGYHCNPEDPLPFLALAAQKGSINFYHMGMYARPDLLEWFKVEYSKVSRHKVDIGKSCVRFKYYDEIPHDLIARLLGKMSVRDWIGLYEAGRGKRGRPDSG